MAWTKVAETLANDLPRDRWRVLVLGTQPLSGTFAIKVSPRVDLLGNVNACGFVFLSVDRGLVDYRYRSRIIPFTAPRNAAGYYELALAPQSGAGVATGSQWRVNVSIPRWFPDTDIELWRWLA